MLFRFVIIFLLLMEARLACDHDVRILRCMLGALIGGAEGWICLIPGGDVFHTPVWRVALYLLICAASFGFGPGLWKCWVVYGVEMSVIKVAARLVYVDSFSLLFLIAGGSVVIWFVMQYNRPGVQKIVPISISLGGKRISLMALKDTGNVLSDPITGDRVFVISANAASYLTGLSLQEIKTPLETMLIGKIPGLRLIPFSTVGHSEGLMLGMKMQEVKLGNKQQNAIIGFAPEGLGEGLPFQALVSG